MFVSCLTLALKQYDLSNTEELAHHLFDATYFYLVQAFSMMLLCWIRLAV